MGEKKDEKRREKEREKEREREREREKEKDRKPPDPFASARVSVKNLAAAERYLNRELSWVEFNARVLEEAQDDSVPLLERVKFLAILSKNLDEFFEVRVPRLKGALDAGEDDVEADGYRPHEVLARAQSRIREVEDGAATAWNALVPLLARAGVRVLSPPEWTQEQRAAANAAFESMRATLAVKPLDARGPLPLLKNGQIFLGVATGARLSHLVLFPASASRLVKLPALPGAFSFARLEDAVRENLPKLLPGCSGEDAWLLRLTRDTNFLLNEEGEAELVQSIADHNHNEELERPIRLQHEARASCTVVNEIARRSGLGLEDVYAWGPFPNAADLFPVSGVDLPALKDPPQPALQHPTIASSKDLFEAIGKEDLLLFHPYHSYDPVVRLAEQAADDPAVRAIHMTLYRTSSTSPIVAALAKAAKAGKKVSALVEAKARFDEEANVQRAKQLEAAGAKVSLGVKGLKTHGKGLLVEREEGGRVRRYAHLATGNYNEKSAKIYGDLSLFTADDEITSELAQVFAWLEGGPKPPAKTTRRLWNAPDFLRDKLGSLVAREVEHARAGRHGRIVVKLNAIADRKMIEQLYAAADQGVEIDLIIRGVCTLRPGSGKVASRLRARRLVDRYLEHARVLWFGNGGPEQGQPEVFLSSADWMGRNLDKRVELLFKLKGEKLAKQVWDYLELQLADDTKARKIERDGSSTRVAPAGAGKVRSQTVQYERLAKS
ncbi:polyphosphate kinase 1 [bacterium]|nr:polyphosphate kinase 1 [bacterium]